MNTEKSSQNFTTAMLQKYSDYVWAMRGAIQN